jgi:hypothetical protein
MAVGHSILVIPWHLVIAWHLLTNDCDYADLGGDYFVRRAADAPASEPSPNSRPSATRSPSNPSPHDRGFSFQDDVYPDRLVSVSMTCPQTYLSATTQAAAS